MNIFENFRVDRFLFALKYMGLGMLCIFIVIAVVILSVIIMNSVTEKIANRKSKNDSSNGNE